ncbi:MAG TPA: PPOX class F420-dependent oxidoreductase [Chloroflexia bacterium]|nr:PPOX class F420-dependent oxidoreductase [Chloroflexia bacterium]
MTLISDSARAFLRGRRFAVVATLNPDGTPQQSVMWYDVRGDTLIMNTQAHAVKVKNLRRDPRIYVCVEDEYRYVNLAGRAEIDYDPARTQADIAALAERYEGPDGRERMVRNTFSKQQRVTIHVPIERVDPHGV